MLTISIILAVLAALAGAGYLTASAGAQRWLTPLEWWGRARCQHDLVFVRNLYGDQIIEWGYKRSVWRCSKCSKVVAQDRLATQDAEGILVEPSKPPQDEICPACRGSGEGVRLCGGGPDAYDVPCECAKCGGSGVLTRSG